MHPAGWPARAGVRPARQELAGLAGRVRTVPVPLAAAGAPVRASCSTSGTPGTEVDPACGRRIGAELPSTSPIGGARLDGVLAGWLADGRIGAGPGRVDGGTGRAGRP